MHKFLGPLPRYIGTLVLYCLVTVYFDVQQHCLELQKIVYLVIRLAQFIPTSPSSGT